MALTLLDNLDAHLVMNDTSSFQYAVQVAVDHVGFNIDKRVHVFELTIRCVWNSKG